MICQDLGLNISMTLPAVVSNIIDNEDFNASFLIADQILGQNDDGYGLLGFYSIPVTSFDRVTAEQWNNLAADIGIIYEHITGSTSSIGYVVTGSSISTSFANTLYSTSTFCLDPSRRWTCHPSQFELNTLTNTTTWWTTSSERSLVWGEVPGTGAKIPSVTHKVVASWPTRDEAYWYFNQGAYLVWEPYHLNNGVNDLDGEWASFINTIRTSSEPYRYGRTEFREYPGGTSTVFTAPGGQKTITVSAEVSANEEQVTFTIEYTNLETTLITITPGVGYYNFTV